MFAGLGSSGITGGSSGGLNLNLNGSSSANSIFNPKPLGSGFPQTTPNFSSSGMNTGTFGMSGLNNNFQYQNNSSSTGYMT